MSLDLQRKLWVLFFFIIVLAAFVVPFAPPLRYLGAIYGSFLFWTVFAVIVIAAINGITRRWRD